MKVWSWGSNEFGQLGLGKLTTSQLDPSHFASADDFEQLEPLLDPVLLQPKRQPDQAPLRIVALAAGAFHTLLLSADGDVLSFGLNSHGQLARHTASATAHLSPKAVVMPAEHEATPATAVAAGIYHSVVVLRGGVVCSFGDNSHGQLGSDAAHRQNACQYVGGEVVQVAAGELHTLVLTSAGTVLSWGSNMQQQCGRSFDRPLLTLPGSVQLPIVEGEVAAHISAGGYRSVVVTSLGRVLTLGLEEEEIEALATSLPNTNMEQDAFLEGGFRDDLLGDELDFPFDEEEY